MTHPLFRFFIFFIGFHGWIGGILAYRITHGFSRNFGRWPMARALYMLLLFFVTQISQMTQIFPCGDYFVPQISQIYTDFSLRDKIFIGFHGWIGRHSCLSDFSRNFADIWPLVNGLRPIYAPVVFCHADFADDADFSLWGLFRPTDFTDIHRFFMESLLNLFVHSQGVSAPTGQVASAKIRE